MLPMRRKLLFSFSDQIRISFRILPGVVAGICRAGRAPARTGLAQNSHKYEQASMWLLPPPTSYPLDPAKLTTDPASCKNIAI